MLNRRDALKSFAGATASATLTGSAVGEPVTPAQSPSPSNPGAAPGVVPAVEGGLAAWLATSLHRVYPSTTPQEMPGRPAGVFKLAAARNYKLSFQVCVRNELNTSAQLECAVSGLDGIQIRVRRVGLVPMHHLDTYVPLEEVDGVGKIPGLCPDPLFPESTTHIGPKETVAFWISLYVPAEQPSDVRSGVASIKLLNRFGYMGFDNPEPFTISLPFEVQVADLEMKERTNFPATVWLSADSIWEHYRVAPCSEPFWELAEAYIQNLVDHHVDVVYTPIFNIRAELLKRPAQLLRVKKTADGYAFDFTDVRRWIRLAMKCGANFVEFSHFFSPAPESAAYPQKIYAREDAIGELLWLANTPATSEVYRQFLAQFLPQFNRVLEEEKVLDKALFHLADEPDGEAAVKRYRSARALLNELAPWIKVMDAMSDPAFATERLSDMPIPSIATAGAFTAANCPAWVYYCCGPRDGYIQRLLDTPLWKIRFSGWLLYRLRARGFLHWGYNYWFKFCTDVIADPYQDATNGSWPGMPYGDTFAVYPGPKGPIDSIRWEVFAESLQDYALLQARNISPDDEMLAPLKDYNSFPKNAAWLEQALQTLLAGGLSETK